MRVVKVSAAPAPPARKARKAPAKKKAPKKKVMKPKRAPSAFNLEVKDIMRETGMRLPDASREASARRRGLA